MTLRNELSPSDELIPGERILTAVAYAAARNDVIDRIAATVIYTVDAVVAVQTATPRFVSLSNTTIVARLFE